MTSHKGSRCTGRNSTLACVTEARFRGLGKRPDDDESREDEVKDALATSARPVPLSADQSGDDQEAHLQGGLRSGE